MTDERVKEYIERKEREPARNFRGSKGSEGGEGGTGRAEGMYLEVSRDKVSHCVRMRKYPPL